MLIVKRPEYEPVYDTLVLVCPAHVVVGVVRELKDVGRLDCFVVRGVSVFGGILVHDRVGIGRDILVGVESDEPRRADASVDIVCHEALSEAGDNNVIGDGRQLGEVCDSLEPLVDG